MKNYKKIFIIIIIIILYYSISKIFLYSNDIYAHTLLYPQIKPLNTDYIKVSEIHTLCYSTYGNINGKPILYVHGGPGGNVTDNAARFFNPKYYYIILVDQRGCGKSIPLGELKENTTQDLIEDFEKIRKKLNINKWQLFGGSWGSTLSLAYAITYPEIIINMVLRGIFLSTPEEIEWIYGSNNLISGVSKLKPIAWDYFKNTLPTTHNSNYIQEYNKCFNGKFGKEKRDECLSSWSVLETSIVKLHPDSLDKIIETSKQPTTIAGALIENHYLLNNCFFN